MHGTPKRRCRSPEDVRDFTALLDQSSLSPSQQFLCLGAFSALCQNVRDCRLHRTAQKLLYLGIIHHVVLYASPYVVACCTQQAHSTTWRVGWRYGDSSATLYTAIRWSFWNSRGHSAMCVYEHTNSFARKSVLLCQWHAEKLFMIKSVNSPGHLSIAKHAGYTYMWAFLTLTPIAALRQPLTSLAAFIVLCCLCRRQVACTASSSHSWTSGWSGCIARRGTCLKSTVCNGLHSLRKLPFVVWFMFIVLQLSNNRNFTVGLSCMTWHKKGTVCIKRFCAWQMLRLTENQPTNPPTNQSTSLSNY